jgi:hypothetical protein
MRQKIIYWNIENEKGLSQILSELIDSGFHIDQVISEGYRMISSAYIIVSKPNN